MKKIILATIGMVVIASVCWLLLLGILNSEVNKIKSNVGLKIILEKDTVMIIDYSLLKNNYTLSSGKEISFDLVERLPIIK